MSAETRRDVFQAIADPTRRQIIELLSKEPMTINVIAEKFEMSRPAISQHIKLLTECDLIEIEQKGRERYCQMKHQNLIPAFLWLEKFQQQWVERVTVFENYVNQLEIKKKKK